MRPFWAARPYVLCAPGEGGDGESADEGGGGGGGAADEAAGGLSKASARKEQERREAQRREWSEQNLTPSGRRTKYADPRLYFIPEHGRLLDGSADAAHYSKVRAAIVAWVACNPGLAEAELLERFWGHPMCVVRGVLHALEAEGTLWRSELAQPPRGLFDTAQRAAVVHYFLSGGGRASAFAT